MDVHFMDLRRRTGLRRTEDQRLVMQTPVICALDIVEWNRPPFLHDVTYLPEKATCADCRARIDERPLCLK